MERKVLEIRVTECRASRPTSGHSNCGNKSPNRRDSLSRKSLFTEGDLWTQKHNPSAICPYLFPTLQVQKNYSKMITHF